MGSEKLGNGKGCCETPSVTMVFGPEPCTCSLALLVYLYVFSWCPELCPVCPESMLDF